LTISPGLHRSNFGRLWLRAALVSAALAVMLAVCGAGVASAASSVTVHLDRPQQIIDGFGVNANVHSWHDGELRPAIDAIEAMGARTWRVIIERANWEDTNDDGDPSTFNWDAYDRIYETGKMADLWNVIAAIETYPGQRVMINVMGSVPTWMGDGRIDPDQEDEWVETMASLVYYARMVRHLRIDYLGPMNEPDLGGPESPRVQPDQYVRLLHKLAARLDQLGLGSTKLVGPDVGVASTGADSYYPALAADPFVMQHLAAVGIHNYNGEVGGIDAAIARSAFPATPFWLTEFSTSCTECDLGAPNPGNWDFAGGDVDQLFKYLDAGASGAMAYDAWDGYYEHHESMGYWGLLAYDATTGTYTPRKSYYALEQVMRYVPLDAVRVTTDVPDGGPVDAQAFADSSTGRVTLVLRNTESAPETVTGAIVGGAGGLTSFSRRYTDAGADFAADADVPVDGSGSFTVTVRPDSVETLTGLTGDAAPTPEPTPVPTPSPPAPARAPPPTTTITSGPTAATTSTEAVFTFAADDDAATFECALDGGDWTPCTSPRALSALKVDEHTFSVRASSASGTGQAATRTWTVSATASPPTTLLGHESLEPDLDAVDAGSAEAFPFEANSSGSINYLHVYVDASTSAQELVAGVYTDESGHPGRLLAQHVITAPEVGAWSTAMLAPTPVSGGERYWLAVLGRGGMLAFRDHSGGGCSSETSASSSLTTLPSSWDTGTGWSSCLISAYASSS
jgi:O-glycosyl hydrolase